ncbi:hypothetical protein [Pantoea sp. Nvir]|uniref:hypothetical protein n=1 Tax=Pantoea sp. Nvir TaxID=2576760 RepID=UPI0013587C62|nr:hypothetical protein [Pantoea sp. Nvir]CAJ0993091.1 hypothetical protein NVIRPANT_00883 [Pantoea sp. Nvir]
MITFRIICQQRIPWLLSITSRFIMEEMEYMHTHGALPVTRPKAKEREERSATI